MFRRFDVLRPVFTALFALPLLLVCASHTLAQVAVYRPIVGEPHPDFILPSIDDGEPIQLSSLRGKKVLLMHFASW